MSYTVEEIKLPFSEAIPNNLNVGDEVVVRGKVKKDASRFVVNLQTDGTDNPSNIAFHFNPRQDQAEVVRNSMVDGSWGGEEKDGPQFPFPAKAGFEIRITVTPNNFVVYVNGQHFCNYSHRVDLRSVSHIFVNGDAHFTEVGFKAFFGARYRSIIPGELGPGRWIVATVATHQKPRRFDINLACDCSDDSRAFHFNPRFYQAEVVRNSLLGGGYGDEEKSGGFPFEAGKVYEIGIQVLDGQYKVYVNKEFFTSYNHRCPPNEAHYLTINGDVSVLHVSFLGSLVDDFHRAIPELKVGDRITVIGSVMEDASRICINLQGKTPDESSSDDDEERHTDIMLHFNPRWDAGEIVLNTMKNGNWGDEEKYPLPSAFFPGNQFNVVFDVTEEGYNITVNGQYIAHYGHRIKPKKVRFIHVAGTAFYSSVRHQQKGYAISDNGFLYK